MRRLTPLAGVLFAVLTIAAYLTMDQFPDGSTPAGDLPAYYAAHGGPVALGGTILGLAGVFSLIEMPSRFVRPSFAVRSSRS